MEKDDWKGKYERLRGYLDRAQERAAWCNEIAIDRSRRLGRGQRMADELHKLAVSLCIKAGHPTDNDGACGCMQADSLLGEFDQQVCKQNHTPEDLGEDGCMKCGFYGG